MGRKYITIDKEEEATLYKFIESSVQAREKKRAMAILLNSQRVSIYNIAEKLEVNKDVVYDWIIKFTNYGIDALKDRPIPGRLKKIKKEHHEEIKTVVVLDNASFHKSKIFKENIVKWANRGLTLLYLPPYSPELNIIEMLWRFIKYHWMEMSAYQRYTAMKEFVQKMLNEYGDKRVINFSIYEEKLYPLVVRR